MIRRLMDLAEARFGAGAGIIPAAALCAIFGAVVLIIGAPTGPSRPVEGVVTGVGKDETELGSKSAASVRLLDGFTVVRLRHGQRCAAGDRIDLRVRPRLWNMRSYSVGPNGCKKPPGLQPRRALE